MKITVTSISLAFVLIVFTVNLYAEETGVEKNKLIIVSSFPKEMTLVFETAFETANPDIDVEVIKKKTTDGLKYVEENSVDMFWVSAPDAFEVLKEKQQLQRYRPKAKGIPRRIGGYPVNDPEGFYSGFSAAGYGIMWNKDYLKAHNLNEPRKWLDLARPEYFGHVSLSAPSRSGTTHLTMEAILQLKGWRQGWSFIKAITGNAKEITAKSSQVPEAVINGEVGIGIVIDSYGLAALAKGEPVDFAYPPATVFVPANIGILAQAAQPELAQQFIEFLLTKEGQELLLHPDVGRLPILPITYQSAKVPDGYPQPYRSEPLGSHTAFNVLTSQLRYNLVNSMFDVMVTYQLNALQDATKQLQRAEEILLKEEKPKPALAAAMGQARDLINYLPVTELSSYDPKFTAVFTKKRKKAEDVIPGKQGRLEQSWEKEMNDNYRRAAEIITQALQTVKMVEK